MCRRHLPIGPLALGVPFAIVYSLTAAAFQITYGHDFKKYLAENEVSWRQKAWWSLQLPFSTIANLTSFFLAWDGIDRWVPGSLFALKMLLIVLAFVGCSVEAFFGVLATDYIRDELKYNFHFIQGLFCERYKKDAYKLNARELADELAHFGKMPEGDLAEQANYEKAEESLPYPVAYRRGAAFASMIWGTGSAACFTLTVVPFMLNWLANKFPELTEEAYQPYRSALIAFLIVINAYNLIFCTVFGNMGARAFFNKILPSLIDKERALPALLSLLMVGASIWILAELALMGDSPAVNIFAALNVVYAAPSALRVITNLLPAPKRKSQSVTVTYDVENGGADRPLLAAGSVNGHGSITADLSLPRR
jgi:hypothetical protein